MQESDRQMLMEFWLFQLLRQGSRPLAYARPRNDRDEALVAFLLPVAEHDVGDADCQITLDPGPPCRVGLEFKQHGQAHTVTVTVDGVSGCQPADLLSAAEQVDVFWLFVGQEDSPAIILYQVAWQPQNGD